MGHFAHYGVKGIGPFRFASRDVDVFVLARLVDMDLEHSGAVRACPRGFLDAVQASSFVSGSWGSSSITSPLL